MLVYLATALLFIQTAPLEAKNAKVRTNLYEPEVMKIIIKAKDNPNGEKKMKGFQKKNRLVLLNKSRSFEQGYIDYILQYKKKSKFYRLSNKNKRKLIREIKKKHKFIKSFNYDFLMGYIESAVEVDDPFYSKEWHLRTIGFEAGNDFDIGEREILVAVIDSGIDNRHIEFQGRLVPGYNTHENNNDTFPDTIQNPDTGDWEFEDHGTKVSGVIAAVGNNDEGVIGVCGLNANIKIMPIKVSYLVDGGPSGFDASAYCEGIKWAVRNGADIISISLGDYMFFDPHRDVSILKDAVDYANKNGVPIYSSAGNKYWHDYTYFHIPSDIDGYVKVGGTMLCRHLTTGYLDHLDDLDGPPGHTQEMCSDNGENEVRWIEPVANEDPNGDIFWSLDQGTGYGNKQKICAPAKRIWTTGAMDKVYYIPKNDPIIVALGLDRVTGTSYAAPMTAAVAALVKSQFSDIGPNGVNSILYRTATDLGDTGRDDFYGHGRVDMADAWKRAGGKGQNYQGKLQA